MAATDIVWQATVRTLDGELVEMTSRPSPRHLHLWKWATVIVPDAVTMSARPLCLDDVQLHHSSSVVSYLLALARDSLIDRALNGLFGGFIVLPPHRQIVQDLCSTGSRVQEAFAWLERLAVLRPRSDIARHCYQLSPYVYFVGRQTRLERDDDYAADRWTPDDAVWEDFWRTASKALPALYRRRLAAEVARTATNAEEGDGDGEKKKSRKRKQQTTRILHDPSSS